MRWGIMQERVYNKEKIANVEELRQRIVDEWECLDQRIIECLFGKLVVVINNIVIITCIRGVSVYGLTSHSIHNRSFQRRLY